MTSCRPLSDEENIHQHRDLGPGLEMPEPHFSLPPSFLPRHGQDLLLEEQSILFDHIVKDPSRLSRSFQTHQLSTGGIDEDHLALGR
jgi:hypothetical protein